MKVRGRELRAVWWEGGQVDGRVMAVDQRTLPHSLSALGASTVSGVAKMIRDMVVRGAPTIGATAAYGMVLGADDPTTARATLEAARPTARDLFAATAWMVADEGPTLERAQAYADEVVARCRAIGAHGAEVLERHAQDGTVRALTHCHAGAFAAVDVGTALAPFHHLATAVDAPAVQPFVWVDETRPRVQGAITAWELGLLGVPHRVVVDNAAGHLMARGEVDMVIVGADRIAANGDVANKIGTYTKAVLAARHDIPFYVAAPASTFDFAAATGAEIPIEDRGPAEVLTWGGQPVYPAETEAANPAFDVTPHELVSGFVTELGILSPNEFGILRDKSQPAHAR